MLDNSNQFPFQFIYCVQASLERGVAVCRGTSEADMVVFETETMSMAMGLLTAVMAGAIKVLALQSGSLQLSSCFVF